MRLQTMRSGDGIIADGALAFDAGAIVYVGPDVAAPPAAIVHDGRGRLLTPGLIDAHTHLVYAGSRAAEWEARLGGASYAQLAAAGGGITATVRATRAADAEALAATALPRLRALVAHGVTTVEIKSGYGLDLAAERRMLQCARDLGRIADVDVRTTFLGAHAVAPEFTTFPDAYVEAVCSQMLPVLARERLVDAVDAFCESVAFSPAQVARVFDAARALGLPVKLHADQLSDGGGALLAARYGALSADHCEYTGDDGVAALAAAGTVAVLLPGALYVLRERRLPPVERLRAAGVPIAIATDCNPGTSPLVSPLFALHLACTLLGLTPLEALAGMTAHAARALGLADRGVLAPGMRADFVLWDAEHPRDIPYVLGANPAQTIVRGGRALTAWEA